jgi:DNA polymerase-3 subunit chi
VTTAEENPNGASMLVLADGTTTSDIAARGSRVEIFDGGDESAVAAARERWKAYRRPATRSRT